MWTTFSLKSVSTKSGIARIVTTVLFYIYIIIVQHPGPGLFAALVFGVPCHYLYSADFRAGTPACQQTSAPAAMVSSMVVMRQSFPVSSRALSSMPWDSSPAIFRGARFTMAMTRFPTSFSGSG